EVAQEQEVLGTDQLLHPQYGGRHLVGAADERGLLLAEQRPGDTHVERVGRLVGVGQAGGEAERAVIVPLHLEGAVDPRQLGLLVARREDVHPGANTQAASLRGIPAELKRTTLEAVRPARLLARLVVGLEYLAQPGAWDGVDVAVDAVRRSPRDRACAGDRL